MSERGYDRRRAAGRIAAAAIVPFCAQSGPLSSALARPAARATPAGSFVLERVLTRELGDGASIVVTRRWRIGFTPAEAGMIVGGAQTFAEVAAPAALSPLAALEKTRSTERMFPIKLDRTGQIAASARAMDAAQLLRAIEVGRVMIEAKAGTAGQVVDARSFLAQLAGMGAEAVSQMPRDLFFPVPTHTSATRDVTLPGGDAGTIAVTTDASVYPGSGLLRASERTVVTRIGSSARTSREGWILTSHG